MVFRPGLAVLGNHAQTVAVGIVGEARVGARSAHQRPELAEVGRGRFRPVREGSLGSR